MATATKHRMVEVSELGALSKDALLEVGQNYGLEDGAALASARREVSNA